ncbi:MAG: hypothetical protein AAB916_01035 [Patescibacteria group bacterium]
MSPWIIIAATLYFAYNIVVVSAMLQEAVQTSWRKSGCTVARVISAFFVALPLHTTIIFVAWILPLWFPHRFKVSGERIRRKECFDVIPVTAEHGGIFSYYQPRLSGKMPAVIILPIFGRDNYQLERYFARYFAGRGLAAIVVHRGKEEVIGDERMFNIFLFRSVMEGISVVNWAQAHPAISADRIAIFGISMGAIRGALLAAVDQRIAVTVLGLAGGDLPYIIRHCQDGAWRGRGISARRATYLKEKRITPEVFERRLRKHIVWDPLRFAQFADPDKILLILAAFDRVIHFKKGLLLRRAMKKPKTVILPSGHYTAMLYLPLVRWIAWRFIKKKLRQ